MKAIRLRTEYLKSPLGIDIPNPRLMWNCEGGTTQTAYQIVTERWDSGKIESASMYAVYPKELKSRERVNWRVRLWDETGLPGEWSESFFETGLLGRNTDYGASARHFVASQLSLPVCPRRSVPAIAGRSHCGGSDTHCPPGTSPKIIQNRS